MTLNDLAMKGKDTVISNFQQGSQSKDRQDKLSTMNWLLGLKTFLHHDLSDPEFYGDLIYKIIIWKAQEVSQ